MTIAEKLTQIAENEQKVYDAGYAKGQAEGGGAYDEGFEAGKVAEYDAFWDAYQDNGISKQYHYAFAGYGWNDATFYPKYDIVMQSSCLGAFQYSKITDIAERLKECGIALDTSDCSNFQAMFAYATTKSLPTINTLKAGSLTSIFTDCKSLERIEKLVVKENQQYKSSFDKCYALKHILFEGEIGNNLDLQYSPLSKASIESIVEHLSDTATGKTLMLSQTAVNNAFDGATIEGYEYVDLTPVCSGADYTFSVSKVGGACNVAVNGGTSWEEGAGSSGGIIFHDGALPAGEYELSFDMTGGEGQRFALAVQTANDFFALDINHSCSITLMEGDSLMLNYDLMEKYNNATYSVTLKRKTIVNAWDALVATKPNWTITLA